MTYDWDETKNRRLKEKRGVSFLKTIYPSRHYTKRYLGRRHEDEAK